MRGKWLLGLVAWAAVMTLGVGPAAAISWTEVGDAGTLPPVAQDAAVVGPLDAIIGALTGYDDIDMYKIAITDPDAFSAIATANLSVDNDAQLFVFDSNGFLVASDDDDGAGMLPAIFAGELSGNPAGTYYLALDLWNTDPVGDPITGWNSNPGPQQTGPYQVDLTGAAGTGVVPEPVTILGLCMGLGSLTGYLRRRAA